MAESEESTSSGFVTAYDFTRYVLIINKSSLSPKDVENDICEQAPHRVISNDADGLEWNQIIIKYPSRKIALREGIILTSHGAVGSAYDVEMVRHILVFLAKLESECDDTSKKSTYISISKFSERIAASKWKKLLSKFGRVDVRQKYSKDGELFIIAMYETMAEAVGVVIALHGHTVDGKDLVVKLCRMEKENRLFSVYRETYKKCPSLAKNFPIESSPVRFGADSSEPQKREEKSSRNLLCDFCSLEPDQFFTDFYPCGAKTLDDADVSWEDEFPEFKDNIAGDGFVLIDDEWELVDEACSIPSLEEDCWQIVNLNDFQEKD